MTARDAGSSSVSADFEVLRRLVLQERQVDLVALGPFLNFMFIDDAAYKRLPSEVKRRSLADQEKFVKPAPMQVIGPRQAVDAWTLRDPIERLLLASFLLAERVTFLDVGCQYGTTAMQAALALRSLGSDAPVLAFDCGIAAMLAPLNIENNGFADQVHFEACAVGSIDGWVLVHRELEHSEDNRLVNPAFDSNRGSVSLPVRSTTLDRLRAEGRVDRSFVAKIDTQGAEPAVIAGARRLMSQGRHAMILEFTPHALQSQVNPVDFASQFFSDHEVFDLSQARERVRRLRSNEVNAFVDSIVRSPSGYTDLLLLAKGFEPCERVVAKLASL